ncbi:DMT family transporter [Sediminicurvatus halobius]|uniref:EamA/RhaT family transporter n=1 Tax=Sediminicurvatus halobius TaxID=2182432 RepID=A0A2U2MWE6_9GAMM|nr:DMT family transporter [Spiribacter halobius]PWG61180.1 EamA/RhaT family transporter [Spiribacter halobius]UEX77628.1 DMT family transporter [Spiribacter halobius]
MKARVQASSTAALAAVFVILWSSGFVGAEFGLPHASPATFLLWRYLALTLILVLSIAFLRRVQLPGRRDLLYSAIVGVLAHGVWLGCVFLAIIEDVPVGIIALITALQPLATGAISGIATGEGTSVRQWVGLVIGFCGVALAVGTRIGLENSPPLTAYLIPLGSVVGITAASIIERRQVKGRGDHQPELLLSMLIQSAATAIAMLPLAWFFEGFATDWTLSFVATTAWLIFGVSLGAYGAMWMLLRRTDATRVASLFYLSPPVTMFMAWIMIGDTPRAGDFLGLCVAGLGVLLVYWRPTGVMVAR